MNNKRLLLLGITIIGSGWMYPNHVDSAEKGGRKHLGSSGQIADKDALSGKTVKIGRAHV